MTPAVGPGWYFLHIPKTAGTSLIAWLRQRGGLAACPHELWSLLLREERRALDRYDLFCGHFYCYLEAYLARSLRTFTFLRDPLDRAYSHYRHVARDPHHYFHERAKEQSSFLAFMRDPVTQPLVRNFQTRALAAVFDPVTLKARLPREGAYPLERYLETAPSGLHQDDELALAKDYLDRCVFVGISERMQESAMMLARALDVADDGGPAWLNRDVVHVPSWSPEEERLAAELNANDQRLYEHALALFARQEAGRAASP